ncbi:MAG: glycosyltransferase family 2 protein [Candidatus Shapirobacteria bacterium]
MTPKVAIVVLNWQQPKLTIDCLKSLLSIKPNHYQLHTVLVDNGSTDTSPSQFHNLFGVNPAVTLINNQTNLGYVEGNNVGLKYALLNNFDYVVVLNNDTRVDPNFLKPLIDFSIKHHHRYLLGPKIYFAPGFEYQKTYKPNQLGKVIWSLGGIIDWANLYGSNLHIDQVDLGQFKKPITQLDFVSGCCLFIPRRILTKIGLFDSKYFLYLEDADYCQRSLRAGFKLATIPKSIIWHYNSGSSGASSNLHHYFLSRNRLLFGFRYSSLITKFHLFLQSLTYLFNPPSIWHRRAIIDYYTGHLAQGSWPKK